MTKDVLINMKDCNGGIKHSGTENKVRPGKFIVEPPTLLSLGFEWYIEGDENHNATVKVWYRKKETILGKKRYPFFAFKMRKAYINFITTASTI